MGIIRVGLTGPRRLPVYAGERTFPGLAGMSQRRQESPFLGCLFLIHLMGFHPRSTRVNKLAATPTLLWLFRRGFGLEGGGKETRSHPRPLPRGTARRRCRNDRHLDRCGVHLSGLGARPQLLARAWQPDRPHRRKPARDNAARRHVRLDYMEDLAAKTPRRDSAIGIPRRLQRHDANRPRLRAR
jgi:hypothetical protein